MVINLGRKTVADFPVVGSMGSAASFNVPFNCEIPNRKVTITFQGTEAAGLGAQGVLQSSLPGIGVQLLNMKTGQPLALNSALSTALVSDSASTATLPFGARYYRTGSLTPGSANATATLSITYL